MIISSPRKNCIVSSNFLWKNYKISNIYTDSNEIRVNLVNSFSHLHVMKILLILDKEIHEIECPKRARVWINAEKKLWFIQKQNIKNEYRKIRRAGGIFNFNKLKMFWISEQKYCIVFDTFPFYPAALRANIMCFWKPLLRVKSVSLDFSAK